MDIQDLQIFVRVAALQNLSAVGNQMGLTPGTISKRIQALETDLVVRLFDRTTRSIRITDEGQRFLVHAQRMLDEYESAKNAIATHINSPVGRLRIAAPEMLGRVLVCSTVNTFAEKYPQISVQLDLTDRQVNLHEEGYDIAIHVGDLGDSSLIARKLASDRRIYVASPTYIQRHGAPQTAADLIDHRCLALGDTHFWAFARGTETEESVRLPVVLRSSNSEVLRRAALEGMGILQTTVMQIGGDLAEGRLVQVLANASDPEELPVHALYLGGKQSLPRLRMFLDHLIDDFREFEREETHSDVPHAKSAARLRRVCP